MKRVSPALCLLLSLVSTRAEVRLSNLFSDGMVLQRGKPAPVWGTAKPGEEVSLSFAGQTVKATADAAGKWSVKLAPLALDATPKDLTVAGGPTVKNVVVGDVWICSGQSNMEMTLGGCNAPDDVKSADFPLIRRIKFDHRSLANPNIEVGRKWEVCTPNSAPNFTAPGFYFARRVLRETGVPVGLIDSNWGGSRIEPWIPPAGWALEPSLKSFVEEMARKDESYRATLSSKLDGFSAWIDATRKALATPGSVLPDAPNFPSHPLAEGGAPVAMYNGMIHPLVPLAITGALWYQGESNGGEGPEYTAKMRALVGGWRAVFGQGDFPFYFVQLANFQQPTDNPAGGDGWARVRSAQTASLAIPNTGMAVIIDIGEANDIHPRNKLDVGERLAVWALRNDYGKKDIVVSGPLFKALRIDGASAVVEFDHVGGGLMVGKKTGVTPTAEVPGGTLTRFAIAGADKQWVWADAKIEGTTVRVSSPKVPAPVAVRYAYSMNPEGCNLYNREGLPASPFRTDEW